MFAENQVGHALRFRIGLIAGFAATALSVPSVAYNDDGHFYTIIASSRLNHRNAAPAISPEEAVIAGFCAQIPDMAKELDATTLRYRYRPSFVSWGFFSTCFGQQVRHMVNVHEYLHALTDSAAAPVTDAAVEITQSLRQGSNKGDPNQACAVGFALHLLGDSFAHRRLSDPAKTYPPGTGHVRDWHKPDYIAFDGNRAVLWMEYTRKLADALELKIDPAQFETLRRVGIDNLGGSLDDMYNQDAIIAALMKMISVPPPDDTTVWAPYSPRLDKLYAPGTHIVTKSFAEVVAAYRSVLPAAAQGLDFNKTWSAFMGAAVPAFRNNKITPACPPAELHE